MRAVERPAGEAMVEVRFAADRLPIDRGLAPLARSRRLFDVLGMALFTLLFLNLIRRVVALARFDPLAQRLMRMTREALLVGDALSGVVALVATDRKAAQPAVRERSLARLSRCFL